MEKILIIDGHGLAYRAFYAVPPLNAPDGTPTNAITGFMNMLSRAEEDLLPHPRGAEDRLCCVAVFDAPGPTFRHALLPQYKATRKPSPDEFKRQIPLLHELLRKMGYPVLVGGTTEGESGTLQVEADDVIGSLALCAVRAGHEAVILSSDKDLQQVLGDGVTMLRPLKSGVSAAVSYNAAGFEAEYGFPPSSVPDYLALLGDAADNVPGVAGVGQKTAMQLISNYQTLEVLFGSLDELKPAARRKLEAGREDAFRSRGLIRLKLDVPVDLDACLTFQPDLAAARELAVRLGLSKLAKRLGENHPASGPDRPRKEVRVALSRPARLLTADAKALLKQGKLSGSGGEPLPPLWDFHTAHYLLHPDTSAREFPSLLPEEFVGVGAVMSDDPAADPTVVSLWNDLDAEIESHEGLRAVMEDIDLPLLPVLDRMERWGVRLEQEHFVSLQGELEKRISDISGEIAEQAGLEINLNSPQQVAGLLFEKLGFTPETRTKGKTGYSTSASVLEHLARLPGGEVPGLILEHRELSKMLSGFVVPLQQAAGTDGVIHTTFEAALTGTGRLSSRDPNLQNIPTFGHWADRIKEGLIPVRPGDVFVAADYSQIELRVLAHLSQEPRLLEAFRRGRDIHRETASWVFSVDPEFVTPELRRVAKMINFGLLYGMSSFGLAERLDMPRAEAAGIVKRYFDALPGVQSFLKGIVAEARNAGFTRTLAGRIRPLEEITAQGRGGLDRVLVNTPIQGTAADIARRAMVDFDRAFAEDGDVHLFLQVHDSLVCECPPERLEDVGRSLREIMMGAARLSLPLEVELKTGSSLAEV
ncbi:MAG: DNA polymerase I [Fretibacterium sp.]|nr:DNA polymerase I [Fretibacterium sp.]